MNTNKFKKIFLNVLISLFIVMILSKTANAESLTETIDKIAKEPWKFILSFIDYVAVIGLIFISFVNILNLKIDLYAIKKALPMLILGIILANLSWFFCMMFVDLAEVVMSWLVNIAKPVGDNMVGEVWLIIVRKLLPVTDPDAFIKVFFTGDIVDAIAGLGMTILFFLAGILMIIPIVFFLLIWILFVARGYAIIFLTIISPLAFIMLSIPLTQKFFQQWLSIFLKFVFLGPLMYFMFYIIIVLNKILMRTGTSFMATFFLVIIGLYASVKVPFALAGPIGASLMGLGNKASQFLGNTAGKNLDKSFQGATKFVGQKVGNPNFQGISVLGTIAGIKDAGEQDYQTRISGMAGKGTGENIYGRATALGEAVGATITSPFTGKKVKDIWGAGGSLRSDLQSSSEQAKARSQNEEINRIEKQFTPQGKNTKDRYSMTNDLLDNKINNKKKISGRQMDQVKSNVLDLARNGQLDNYIADKFIEGAENKGDAKSFVESLKRINDSSASAQKALESGLTPTSMNSNSTAQTNHILQQLQQSAVGKGKAEKVTQDINRQLNDVDWSTKNSTNGFYSTKSGGKIHSSQIHAMHAFLANQKRNNSEIFNQNQLGSNALQLIEQQGERSKLYLPHQVNTEDFLWSNSKNSLNFDNLRDKNLNLKGHEDCINFLDYSPAQIDYSNAQHTKILDEYNTNRDDIDNQFKSILNRVKKSTIEQKLENVLTGIDKLNTNNLELFVSESNIKKFNQNIKDIGNNPKLSEEVKTKLQESAKARLAEIQNLHLGQQKINNYKTEYPKLENARNKVTP